MKTILIVDDDDRIRILLKEYLHQNGFNVIESDNGLYIDQKIQNVDLVILDVMMPKISGFDVMEKIAAIAPTLPVIFLSAKSEVHDRISGLELGAYDYIAKPFDPKELLLRINSILNRSSARNSTSTYTYDKHTGILIFREEKIELSSTENLLFGLLFENLNNPLKRETIIEKSNGTISERSVDVQIARIRKKLGEHANLIKTVRHNGYMLVSDDLNS